MLFLSAQAHVANAHMLPAKLRLMCAFCPQIVHRFLCFLLHREFASQDWQMLCWRDSCQHSTQQLGQVLLTSMTSPCHEGLRHCPLRLCDSVSPVLPGGLREHPRGVVESPVVPIWRSYDHGLERRLSLIIRLCRIQGHATDVCHLGLKMTAPSLSLLHY